MGNEMFVPNEFHNQIGGTHHLSVKHNNICAITNQFKLMCWDNESNVYNLPKQMK